LVHHTHSDVDADISVAGMHLKDESLQCFERFSEESNNRSYKDGSKTVVEKSKQKMYHFFSFVLFVYA
jgi:hypothetical protein